MKNVEEEVTK